MAKEPGLSLIVSTPTPSFVITDPCSNSQLQCSRCTSVVDAGRAPTPGGSLPPGFLQSAAPPLLCKAAERIHKLVFLLRRLLTCLLPVVSAVLGSAEFTIGRYMRMRKSISDECNKSRPVSWVSHGDGRTIHSQAQCDPFLGPWEVSKRRFLGTCFPVRQTVGDM